MFISWKFGGAKSVVFGEGAKFAHWGLDPEALLSSPMTPKLQHEIRLEALYVYFAFVFLPRDFMLARYMLSSCVCVPVCLSVHYTPVLCQNAQLKVTQITLHDSLQGLYSFWSENSRRNSNGAPPTGTPNISSVGRNRQLSTSNSF